MTVSEYVAIYEEIKRDAREGRRSYRDATLEMEALAVRFAETAR